MDSDPTLDGAALRAARARAGLSQSDLAREAGLDGGYRLSRWERGQAQPRTAEVLGAVAGILGVSPRDLLLPPENGPSLRWLRFAAGLSVAQLAKVTHTAAPTVKRWESQGLASPSQGTVSRLAEALGADDATIRRALRP